MGGRAITVLAGLALGGAVFIYIRSQDAPPPAPPGPGEDTTDAGSSILNEIGAAAEYVGGLIKIGVAEMTPFSIAINQAGNAAYVARIRAVEASEDIPPDMLVRLAYQESRFRDDIITGRTVSSAGAKGMFQFMPLHWKYVDPTDWQASADYAGAELRRLYRAFGTWALALAAYNWGEGNLKKYGITSAPRETRNYYTQILADIGQPGVTYA